jgi:tetratricopeptide (TPR) repeat protein
MLEGSMLLFRGLAIAQSGDYQRAIDDYDRAIAKISEDKNTSLYLNSMNTDAPYAQAEAIEIVLSGVYLQRAVAYAQLNNAQKAIADLDRAIAIQPNSAEAYFVRGSLYAELKEKEKAIADLTKASQLYQEQGNAQQYRQVQQVLQQLQ